MALLPFPHHPYMVEKALLSSAPAPQASRPPQLSSSHHSGVLLRPVLLSCLGAWGLGGSLYTVPFSRNSPLCLNNSCSSFRRESSLSKAGSFLYYSSWHLSSLKLNNSITGPSDLSPHRHVTSQEVEDQVFFVQPAVPTT